VAAVLLAETARAAEAARLLRSCREILVPSHFIAELGNVLWKAVMFGSFPPEHVAELLVAADALSLTVVDIRELWHAAVARALATRHPVYDTLFVELAMRESVKMASYDRPLQRKFPGVVEAPGAFLHA
jgi:predicted nucleic acid-binding protein